MYSKCVWSFRWECITAGSWFQCARSRNIFTSLFNICWSGSTGGYSRFYKVLSTIFHCFISLSIIILLFKRVCGLQIDLLFLSTSSEVFFYRLTSESGDYSFLFFVLLKDLKPNSSSIFIVLSISNSVLLNEIFLDDRLSWDTSQNSFQYQDVPESSQNWRYILFLQRKSQWWSDFWWDSVPATSRQGKKACSGQSNVWISAPARVNGSYDRRVWKSCALPVYKADVCGAADVSKCSFSFWIHIYI